MLTSSYYSSQKQDDAEDKVDKLCDLVQKTLEQNVIISERLAAFETRELPRRSNMYGSTVQQPRTSDDFSRLGVTNWEDATGSHDEVPNWQRNSRGFAFEELLKSSRVYRNAGQDNSDAFSVISSAGRTASWSMMSGLSLSEISHIAILAIPIYATDITNKDAYDFETLTEESMALIQQSTLLSSQEAKAKGSRRQWLKNFLQRPQWTVDSEQDKRPLSEQPGETPEILQIFGVSLEQSITYANTAIKLSDESDELYTYGYITIVIGKTALFLKREGRLQVSILPFMAQPKTDRVLVFLFLGTQAECIFARNGNAARMMYLQRRFDTPSGYGRGLVWDGYTVHDAAGIMLRYLKSLPDPLIPCEYYLRFVALAAPGIEKSLDGFDRDATAYALGNVREFLKDLPPLNRTLLVYLVDFLAIFAGEENDNKMNAHSLVSMFQPSILSGPPGSMDANAHRVAARVVVFLIENSDHLI